MRRYGTVHTQFWIDSNTRKLSEKAKFLFLFLLTGPHTTSAGCFRLPKSYLAADLKWSPEDVDRYLSELIEVKSSPRLICYCENTEWILIPKFLDYHPIANPNCGVNVCDSLEALPDDFGYHAQLLEMLEPFRKRLKTETYEKIANRCSNGSGNGSLNPLPNREQEQEQEQEHKTLTSPAPSDEDTSDPAPREDESQTEEPSCEENTENLPEEAGAKSLDKVSDCPHQQIIDLYHEMLPQLPRVHVWTDHNRQRLRARWREDKSRQSLDWWRGFFKAVSDSDFLTGRVKDWTATLDWLIGPKNFSKVLNGQYQNREGSPSRKDPIQNLQEWAGEDWVRQVIAQGMAALVADNRMPRHTDILYSASLYEKALVSRKVAVTPQVDGPRIQQGFRSLLNRTSGWPEIRQLEDLIPPRKHQKKIDHQLTDKDREAAKAHLRQLAAQI